MRQKGGCSLLLFFSLFLKLVSEVELIKINPQMERLQSCTPSEENETLKKYINNSLPHEQDWMSFKSAADINDCGGEKSDKIFEMRLTDDGYLDGDGVFYPPDNFCVNL